jgi:6-phosphogluconolactonase
LVANYGGGNISVIPVGDDGSLRAARVTIAHTGNSLHPQRQEGPHPHSIVLDPANNYVFVPDLGLDKVMQYRFDRANGQLSANQPPYSETIPGSGPRHLVFHPSGTKAYVINELDSTVTAYAYDSERGWFERLQTISTLPGDYSGSNLAADLHLTPDGNFLFGSNRGHDSIACYKVDQTTGWLTHLAFIQTGGRKPRGFAIDPTGSYLLAANQESHSIVTFRIDQETGMLNPTGHEARIPNPVCLKFAT